MRYLLVFLLGSMLAVAAWGDDAAGEKSAEPRKLTPLPRNFWKTRPVRRDTPLREENITDLEIAELEAEMKSLYPGTLVYVSAVTTGCPCEDGPDCTAQVWSVATLGDRSRGVALSRINGSWQVGPLQQWWLQYDSLWAAFRASRKGSDRERIRWVDHQQRLEEHKERFPLCVETSIKDIVIAEISAGS